MRQTVPTDTDVRRFLDMAVRHPDPRAGLAVGLLLWQSLSVNQLERFAWTQYDPSFATLTVRRDKRLMARRLSPFMLSLIRRCKVQGKQLFASPVATAPTVNTLMHSILCEASLSHFVPADFLAWSRMQSDVVRESVVR